MSGIYINPPDRTKESWLVAHATAVLSHSAAREYIPNTDGNMLVVLVDNNLFTAAAVAYSLGETRRFLRETDTREKYCYLVPLADLLKPDAGLLKYDTEFLTGIFPKEKS